MSVDIDPVNNTSRAIASSAQRVDGTADVVVADSPARTTKETVAPASPAVANAATVTDDVIDVEGVARLMKVGRNTVYAMVGRNEIPHRRLGKQIRFHREAVMRWLASWSSQGAKEGH